MISGLLIGFVIGALATVAGLIAVGKRHLAKQAAAAAKRKAQDDVLIDRTVERVKHALNYGAGVIQMPYGGTA